MNPIDYNEISSVYDSVRKGDVTIVNRFLGELSDHDMLNILDMGCGTGNYIDIFQRITRAHGFKFFGIDPSEGMLDKARQKNDCILFLQGTAECIPLEDNFIDFAYMTDVIHHVTDIHKMFAEMYRVLRPLGKVCIVTQSYQQIDDRPIVQFFPGTARVDKGRYPDIKEIISVAAQNQLTYLKQEIVFEGEEILLDAGFLNLIRKRGYSMLHLLPEGEYEIGLHALEDALKHGPIHSKSAGETLIWFVKMDCCQ